MSNLRVCEADRNQVLEPGSAYTAPGGIHLTLERRIHPARPEYYVALKDTRPINSCKLSVDMLFDSIAAIIGKKSLIVMMTGMGQDGLNGVESVKRVGVYFLTQSKDTCIIYGIPKVVDGANHSDESVPLSALADRIISLTR